MSRRFASTGGPQRFCSPVDFSTILTWAMLAFAQTKLPSEVPRYSCVPTSWVQTSVKQIAASAISPARPAFNMQISRFRVGLTALDREQHTPGARRTMLTRAVDTYARCARAIVLWFDPARERAAVFLVRRAPVARAWIQS